MTAPEPAWRNRIIGQGTEAPDQLLANPRNFRRHPAHQQRALEGSLAEIGWVQTIIVNRRTGHVVDGHLRVELALRAGEAQVPVLYVDLSEAEEQIALLSLDPIAALATQDDAQLADLIAAAKPDDARLAEFLASLRPAEPVDTAAAARTTLAERFLIPPFSVLDARTGRWQDRKRAWIGLGIRSELGRGTNGDATAGGGLTFALGAQTPATYDRKREAEQRAGHPLTWAEFAAAHPDAITLGLDSIFDPVLTEVAYRWFCPPGGSILDPFAGGSVRGLVAAFLGYHYTGIDLRAEQVEANTEQAAHVLSGAPLPQPATAGPAPVTDPDALTPVERRGQYWFKRDDAFQLGAANGGKARAIAALAPGAAGLIASGSRQSTQIERAAQAAQALGLPCRVHTGAGGDTPGIAAARAAGAEIIQHRPARLSVIKARAREDAADNPTWRELPWGMATPEALAPTAAQTRNLPADTTRLVLAVGSGTTLAAVLHGLDRDGRADLRALGVCIGGDPRPTLDALAPADWRSRVDLVDAAEPYETPAATTATEGVDLDPYYEAKAIPHLRPGDTLWIVGKRSDAPASAATGAPPGTGTSTVTPTWITGDSRDLATLLPADAQFDFLFTCPPYYDLEVYSEDPRDISTSGSYEEFLTVYREITAAAAARLKPDRFAAVVIGEIRAPNGNYRNLVADTIDAHQQAGLSYYNEAILITPVGSLPIRVGRPFKAARKVGKTHQQMLVFRKGRPPDAGAVEQAEAAAAIAQEFATTGALQDQHAKLLVFVKGDPRAATEAAGPAPIDDEATE